MSEQKSISSLAIKIGIAGVVGFGAIASGMIASRKGRNLMREAWQGRQRTTLEDRVLEVLWSDRALARRPIDVQEQPDGALALIGEVRSEEEQLLSVALAEGTHGVQRVIDRLVVVPPQKRDGSIAERLRDRTMAGFGVRDQ
jgi:hypothetical protein